MHPMIESFLERPAGHKLAFWVVSLALIGFLSWQYLIKGGFEERARLQEKIEDLNVQIQEQQRIARDLPKFREEIAELDKKLNVVLRELPDKREIEGLLKSVSVLAVDTGLEVIKFAPKGEVTRDFFAEIPVEIELRGTFHELATFFDEVGHLARIINIRDVAITIESETPQEVAIRATCTATTFRYLEEAERVAPQPATTTGGRRRRRTPAS